MFSSHTISLQNATGFLRPDDIGDYHHPRLVVDIVNIVGHFVSCSNTEAYNFKRANFRSLFLSLGNTYLAFISYEIDVNSAVQAVLRSTLVSWFDGHLRIKYGKSMGCIEDLEPLFLNHYTQLRQEFKCANKLVYIPSMNVISKK